MVSSEIEELVIRYGNKQWWNGFCSGFSIGVLGCVVLMLLKEEPSASKDFVRI